MQRADSLYSPCSRTKALASHQVSAQVGEAVGGTSRLLLPACHQAGRPLHRGGCNDEMIASLGATSEPVTTSAPVAIAAPVTIATPVTMAMPMMMAAG